MSESILILVGLILLVFFTLLGNAFVLLVILCKARRLFLKPLYVFIFNICVSDILATLFTMIFEVYEEMSGVWRFGEPACKIIEYLEMTLFGVNIFTHLSIALERYRNVVQPFKTQMKVKAAKKLVCASWIVPALLSLPYLYTVRLEERDLKCICSLREMPWIWLDKLVLAIELLIVFLVPLAFIVGLYVIIVKTLSDRQRKANVVLPQPTQVTFCAAALHGLRVSVAVVTIFVLCWLPFVVVFFTRLFTGSENVARTSTLYKTALYASYVSELLTPLLYCACDRNIKPALLSALKCRFCAAFYGGDDIVRDTTVADPGRSAEH